MDWHAKMSKALRVASEAARETGNWVLKELPDLRAGEISEKGPRDFVTRLDKGAEKMLMDRILKEFSGDAILSEETPGAIPTADEFWVMDPIDGTNNLIHRYPRWCVGIAYFAGGRPEIAAVFDPIHGELFTCKRDEGVWLNGAPVSVSTVADIGKAYVVSGLPAKCRDDLPAWLAGFGRVSQAVMTTRKSGSAILDLAYVACGRFDGYWEPRLSPWDMAAGSLLVEVAGGLVTDDAGKPWTLSAPGILAANADLHPQLLKLIAP
ncbi:MAG: inositol monophosphatase family protein [Candidatus Coatesbacteria bacterium]